MTQVAEKNGQAEAPAPPPLSEDEARRLAVLSAFGTHEALTSLDALADEIPMLEMAVTQAKLALTLDEEAADLREAELAFEAEGKNAEERKNALALAKKDDKEYQERLAEVLKAKAALGEAERAAQTARHRERYWHAFLATRQAQIAYLAG